MRPHPYPRLRRRERRLASTRFPDPLSPDQAETGKGHELTAGAIPPRELFWCPGGHPPGRDVMGYVNSAQYYDNFASFLVGFKLDRASMRRSR